MNWHKRAQEIFANWRDNGKRSVRRIAAATGIAKSSVHRHQRAMERRNQHPESGLWEVESGQQWLRLLVWAVIYVFGIKQGIGNETKSLVFSLIATGATYWGIPNCVTEATSANGTTNFDLPR